MPVALQVERRADTDDAGADDRDMARPRYGAVEGRSFLLRDFAGE
jgi:hypothetical protein